MKNPITQTRNWVRDHKDQIVIGGSMAAAAVGTLYVYALGYRVGKDMHEPTMGALFKHTDEEKYTFITNSKTGQIKQFDIPIPNDK